MSFSTDFLGISSSEFSLLRDLIHERTGLCYEDGKDDILAGKLSPRVLARGFSSFLDYYYLLRYDPRAEEEWRHVMDCLSVPETFFWREMDQVRALVDVLVPQFFATTPREPLRIWSAACASGEEPVSIAIALEEAGWFRRAPIEIHASDASPAAIARAQAGLYRERAFRNLPPDIRARYFVKEPAGERVLPQIQSRIHWSVANLVSETDVQRFGTANIIFCRNVFIYFSMEKIRTVADLVARYISRPGYLFLGASESLLRLSTGFRLQEIGGAFVYVRE